MLVEGKFNAEGSSTIKQVMLSGTTMSDDGMVSGELTVEFNNGSKYKYSNVSEQIFMDFSHADSKGKYFAQNIRNEYECEKITEE